LHKEDFMLSKTGNLTKSENFRTVFFDIKKKTNEILLAYNNVDFLEDPSVAIEVIAKEYDIEKIERVPGKSIPEKNATLENRVIKVKQEASTDKQNFWIAHELEHHLKNEAKKTNKMKFEEDIKKILDQQNIKQANSVVEEAAAKSNYEGAIKILKEFPFFQLIAEPIAKNASMNFGKDIPKDKAFTSIAKLICKSKVNRKLNSEFVLKATDDLYNEEIADYFAANLLVPIERFMLWEDKTDEEIATAFKVPVECIRKRRDEIDLELEYLAE